MRPVLGSAALREADLWTIQHEPISSLDLMERAAAACTSRIRALLKEAGDPPVMVIAGMGNNGGDGLAIARLLHADGIRVAVVRVHHRSEASADNARNWDRVLNLGLPAVDASSIAQWPGFHRDTWLVDALFGTGLSAPLDGVAAEAVLAMNRSGCRIIAIDLPSGLAAEPLPGFSEAPMVRAAHTLTLEVPKLALLLPENSPLVGEWDVVPIGLDPAFITACPTSYRITEASDAAVRLPRRPRFAHKGRFGHALVLAGREGSMGAAVLAADACSRSGAGLVTVHGPGCGRDVLQAAVPEAMYSVDEEAHRISRIPDLARFTAIGCGPGLGVHARTATALKDLLGKWTGPLVLDADALNIMARERDLLEHSNANWVLTPHPKEFERLAGRIFTTGHERMEHARGLAVSWGCHLLLKGAWSAICCPDGNVLFNPTGNAGMAKGGTGDALTGLLTGLLAQGIAPFDACLLGAYAHGLAGDLAAARFGMDGMTAMDLIDCIPEAWMRLRAASAQHG